MLALLIFALGVACLALGVPVAHAQAPSFSSNFESTHLVPPQGSAPDVPVHLRKVCIFSFSEKLSSSVIPNSTDYEIHPWGNDGLAVAVRAVNPDAAPLTLAFATGSGNVKVNVTLRIVPDEEPTFTLIHFRPATEAEAFEARVREGTFKRTSQILQRIEEREKGMSAEVKRLADVELTERLLRRSHIYVLRTHARNSDNVILHGAQTYVIGGTGYLTFEIQNRSSRPYFLANVRLIADKRNVAGDVRLLSTTVVRDLSLIGIVSPGASARGIVSVPMVDMVLHRPLILEISMPNGRSSVRLDRELEIQ